MIEIIPNWHPYVVHFAIGLLMVSALLFWLATLLAWLPFTAGLTAAARWNLWLGTAFAVLAVLTGLQAYGTVVHDSAGHAAMHDHRLWAFITLGIFVLAFILSLFETDRRKGAGAPLLVVLLAGFVTIGVTGHLGARNVYVHGLGVERLPDPEDHDHHHEAMDSHDHHRDHDTEHEHDHGHGPAEDIESGDEIDEPGDARDHAHDH